VHKEFVPEGETVNAELHKGVMDRLLKQILRVGPAAFCSRDFLLLHDNAPAHKAATVCQFLPKKCYNSSLPPYPADLSSPDYFLFPELKMKLKGLHIAEIQDSVTDELKKSQKEEFLAGFRKLYDRAKSFICANGAYFELKRGNCINNLLHKFCT
jgi:hypothetical protein